MTLFGPLRHTSGFRKFLDEHLPTLRPHGDIYHYTEAAGLIGILQSRQLWLSNALFLNDSAELAHGRDRISGVLFDHRYDSEVTERAFVPFDGFSAEDAERLIEVPTRPEDVYVASFSEKADGLSLWRAYAAESAGFALGFSPHKLVVATDDPIGAIIAGDLEDDSGW